MYISKHLMIVNEHLALKHGCGFHLPWRPPYPPSAQQPEIILGTGVGSNPPHHHHHHHLHKVLQTHPPSSSSSGSSNPPYHHHHCGHHGHDHQVHRGQLGHQQLEIIKRHRCRLKPTPSPSSSSGYSNPPHCNHHLHVLAFKIHLSIIILLFCLKYT